MKICGITRPEDALAAEALGADAVGLVFTQSRRRVDEAQAREVISALGPFVTRVGVFRDQPLSEVVRLVADLRLDVAQLHGGEDETFAAGVRRHARVLRAVSLKAAPDPSALDGYPADAVMLDSAVPGSGQRFDWVAAAPWRGHARLVLAGGLDPDNVAEAIETLAPSAVDVSSGVEAAPGIKDRGLMEAFIAAVRAADQAIRAPRAAVR